MAVSFKIIDESFDSKQTESYRLLLQVKADSLAFSVFYPYKNKFIVLAEDFFNGRSLLEVLHSHPELQTSYKEVKASLVTTQNCFTILPNALFDSQETKHYLQLSNTLPAEWQLMHNPLRFSQAVCAYAAPKSWISDLNALFPKVRIYHHSTTFIDGLIFQYLNLSGKNAYVNMVENYFELVILENGRLLFYNKFPIQSINDLIYYTLFGFEQLNMRPDASSMWVFGNIDEDDVALLKKYIPNALNGNTSPTVDFSKHFNEDLRRQYYNLFSLQLCE